ncbi:transmembrane protein [Cystoisospora suis]|uniref:Transmembrane protein n=1 Tax=Cystoisospora suis TaxID=483139 RepID=A0A2C6LBC2_9APIC|nr:transmembrane protein [Cystoisospora suis]
MKNVVGHGEVWLHDLSLLSTSTSPRRRTSGAAGASPTSVTCSPPPCCLSGSSSGGSPAELLFSHALAQVRKNHSATGAPRLQHPLDLPVFSPVSTTTEHGAQPSPSAWLGPSRVTADGGALFTSSRMTGLLLYSALSCRSGSDVGMAATAPSMTNDEDLYEMNEFLDADPAEVDGEGMGKAGRRDSGMGGERVVQDTDSATAVGLYESECNADHRDIGKLFERALVVASCRAESAGGCLLATHDDHEDAWSDIALTRGSDPDTLVLSAPPDRTKQSNVFDVRRIPGKDSDSRPTINIGEALNNQSATENKCAVLASYDPAHAVASEGRRMHRVDNKGPGRIAMSTGNASSLPARLMRHIWRRMRTYEQRKTNRRHLVVIAASFLIGLTLAVLLICIAHALLDRSVVKEQTFLS